MVPPTPEPRAGSIIDLLRRSMAKLTPTEKKVARALIARYPAAGLGGVTELAEESQTSTASVIRLVQKLGFEGYTSFHGELLHELSDRHAGPSERISQSHVPPRKSVLTTLSNSLSEAVASIASTVPMSEFNEAVRLLSDPKRQIVIVGGRVSHAWAELFASYLARMRRNVTVLPRDSGGRIASVLDLTSKSVLVVFDVRRYENSTVRVAEEAARRGSTVVLVTDLWLSPAASFSDVVLPVAVEVPSPFDTAVTGVALVECLTWSITQSLGKAGISRMQSWDAIASEGLAET
jgi:DNA-binding MurR/RpiR family transcriptional regulator